MTGVEGSSGIRILHKSRDGRTKGRGGGVAIAYDNAVCNLKRRQLKQVAKDFEIICATGKVGKIDRKFVIFVVYVPPLIKTTRFNALKESLAAEITAAKADVKDPVFVIAGDFNHKDISDAVDLVEHMTLIPTGPTRGANTIDLIYTNVPGCVRECMTLPPLEAANGAMSDHRCVYVKAQFQSTRNFRWEVKMRRLRDQRRENAFADDLRNWNWENLEENNDVDKMWCEVEGVIADLTNKHFPLVRVRKRSNESPWITRGIRRLWKKKIRIYKKEGRSQAWWDTDAILQAKIESSRNEFVEKILEEGNGGKSFYAATKRLAKAAVVPQWSVKDLFIGRESEEICREVLDYFGNIASDPLPPMGDVPRCSGGLQEFTVLKTEALLKAAKKTDSSVKGDPLPHLVRCHQSAFAVPIAAIFNGVNRTRRWPAKWKTEHLTVIPKNPNPADLSECRNISCTSIFSKILEGEVLVKLRNDLDPDPNQYGGIPKCGVEHMLVDLWDKILGALEGGTNAAVLLGVDYEKAFNRMRHDVCLEQLSKLGASPGSIALVRAFLEDRRMTITIDGHTAQPFPITRGSPQGSVLGCLLYCITTQLLTKDLRRCDGGGEVRFFPQWSSDEEGINFWEEAANDRQPSAFLYVDDTTLFDAVPLGDASRHYTTDATKETFESLALEGDFERLSNRAKDIGMRINSKKTQLLVISSNNGCLTSAVMAGTTGDEIGSVESMKLVGFTFGTAPNAGRHVEEIEAQYKRKKWMLYHLRDAGIREKQLYRLYCCYVRSSIEYCSAVYHALLNRGQEERLESIHRHALRICFGTNRQIEEIMTENGIETLSEKRKRRCDSFVTKAVHNDRFKDRWFPKRETVPWALRERREIQEIRADTERRFNSPLAYMRRRANDMGLLRHEAAVAEHITATG